MSNEIARLRTEVEVEQDLPYVAQLYVRGIPMREIGQALEQRYNGEVRVGTHLVEDDVVRIRQMWINSTLVEFNERKAIELAHLDQLESAYWKAWEDSCLNSTVKETTSGTEQVVIGGQTHDLKTESNKEVVTGRDGNAMFLQGVERCIEKRCKILGLFSPETYRVDWRADVQKLGWKAEDADRLKENAIKSIMEMLSKAADDQRIASGNIVDGEFVDDD